MCEQCYVACTHTNINSVVWCCIICDIILFIYAEMYAPTQYYCSNNIFTNKNFMSHTQYYVLMFKCMYIIVHIFIHTCRGVIKNKKLNMR